ncbi:MAG: hypothetical protein WBQ94_16605 [Terracidiphilus sp.]
MSFSNFQRSFHEHGEMHVLTGAFDEPHFLDGVEEACRGPVVKGLRWYLRFVPQVNLDAVTLICADAPAVIGELKALLIILSHDLIEFGTGNSVTARSATLKQIVDTAPAGLVESQASFFWFVSKYQTKELARSNFIFIHTLIIATP